MEKEVSCMDVPSLERLGGFPDTLHGGKRGAVFKDS